jgi:hypothetical protein
LVYVHAKRGKDDPPDDPTPSKRIEREEVIEKNEKSRRGTAFGIPVSKNTRMSVKKVQRDGDEETGDGESAHSQENRASPP